MPPTVDFPFSATLQDHLSVGRAIMATDHPVIRVLLIDDSPHDRRLIWEMLSKSRNVSFDVSCEDNLTDGLQRLPEGGIDVLLLDLGLPDSKGLAGRSADLLVFFTFPEAVRHPLAVRKHRASSINIYRGYYPPPAGRHWSYNENFDIGPEPPLPVSDGPGTEGLREANVWPAGIVSGLVVIVKSATSIAAPPSVNGMSTSPAVVCES